MANKKIYIDFDLGGNKILNLGTPAGIYEAATKGYVDSIIPSQTGNNGKYLTTDGTSLSWGTPAGGGGGTAATVAEINAGTSNVVFASPLNLQTSKYVDQYGGKTQGVTAGTSTAYTLGLSPAITAYTTGFTFSFKAHAASGANATINIDGLGAKQLVKDVNTNLVANDLIINQWYTGYYDGTNVLVKELGFAGKNTSATFLAAISNPQGSGQVVFDTNPQFTTAIRGAATFAAFNTTTTTLNFAGAVTTFNCGGTPTTTITANIFTNATASAATKTINIGTGGVSGSITNINLGAGTSKTTFKVGYLTVGNGGANDSSSVAFGWTTMDGVSATGVQNVAVGGFAMRYFTSASNNTAVGYNSMNQLTTGSGNVGIGVTTLQFNQTGSNNLAIGSSALNKVTSSSNIGIGAGTMANATTPDGCIAMGMSAMGSGIVTGQYNLAFGFQSMMILTSGTNNTALGANTMLSLQTGSHNTAMGTQSLQSVTGSYNIGIGYLGGYTVTSGDYNTIIGYYSGVNLTTGSYNTIIGASTIVTSALSNHVIIGDGAGNMRFASDNTGKVYLGGGTTLPTFTFGLEVAGSLKANTRVNFTSLPTSSAGLSSGDLWNDSGTLKII